METPPLPPDEPARLASLLTLRILDTPAEERFDRITRLACRALGTRIALLSLMDRQRQWFKSTQGLAITETSRDVSFCGHAILDSGPLIVPDARLDPRFADNPMVSGPPGVRLYAGHPIRAPDGKRVGTLCVVDSEPRTLDRQAVAALADLAALVENELKIVALGEAERLLLDQVSEAERRASIDGLTRLWNRETITTLLRMESERAARASKPLGLAVVDIDHFKRINDTWGHVSGDRVLAAVAERMRGALRPYDSIGRYGGEEFLAVISEASPEVVVAVGERIRGAIRSGPVVADVGPVNVTVSVGVACVAARFGDDPMRLVRIADGALYLAKQSGRDRVELAGAA
jgi:diguanylate cyclase (GGDEF)-like protein